MELLEDILSNWFKMLQKPIAFDDGLVIDSSYTPHLQAGIYPIIHLP